MTHTHTILGKFPGSKLQGKDRYKRLYHYTSFNSFVKIWLTKSLLFSESKNVNDLQEAHDSISTQNWFQIPLIYACNDIKSEYRQISLTMDYDSYLQGCMSTMMWGHYGDRNHGVCIELDYDKLELPKTAKGGPVKYVKYLPKNVLLDPKIASIKDLRQFIRKNIKEIFFTKQICWKDENEFRIISDVDKSLDIANAITAVYLTDYESMECLLVEKLVNEVVPVKCLRYIENNKNIAIPILSDTKSLRLQLNSARTNQKNALNPLSENAKQYYLEHRHDENFSLLLSPFVASDSK
jgi:hypothetical protein